MSTGVERHLVYVNVMWRRYVCHVNGVERNAAAGLRGVEYLTCRLKIFGRKYLS